MGGAKRMMEEQDAKRDTAMRIALEANVIQQCKAHEDCFFEGDEEIESAYKLGNQKFSRGELDGVFEDRREMTDIVKEVVEDNSAEECYACAKNRDE